jgi:hypothetical protein
LRLQVLSGRLNLLGIPSQPVHKTVVGTGEGREQFSRAASQVDDQSAVGLGRLQDRSGWFRVGSVTGLAFEGSAQADQQEGGRG